MLNIKAVRTNPGFYRAGMEKRRRPPEIVDEILGLDEEKRSIMKTLQELRHRRNLAAEKIAAAKKRGEKTDHILLEMQEVNQKIEELESRLTEVDNRLETLLKTAPNPPHESVPDGETEEDNVVVRSWGEPRRGEWMRDHVDVLAALGLADLETAAKVAGARFYYLFDDLVLLNWALVQYGLDFLKGKGFRLVQPPYMLTRKIMEGVVSFQDFEDMLYKVEGEDLYLIGTAEHPLAGLHAGEILDGRKLPLRYAGISPCFRKEAGAHGKDTKGIFRVHQFEKVEQFSFTKPSQSWAEHEFLISNAEELYRSLGLPYRVVNICVGELGPVAAKKYDLEVWMPAQNKYREVVSCSNCTDYQAVGLGIRYREAPHIEETDYVHTLNSTLIATERTIVAILENYQTRDGAVEIPEPLQHYLHGQKIIRPAAR
ncbi:seryl-tRNA synthetase [Candidatus Caldarchaeum subterraneum]|uniref:Serine--tRNA ligase n=1 Tax=Caldiarchaeum subterraneum TaxID=311458 RepID=E6N872_CALS0|nr:seryl-tRNA synthetase [Candidatus Caldarchaeum subterraneum]BAJ48491.1 seryl-tRNA synthetase [Candidatus Caldarchaeum subterraneum]BAJ49618.1 seryl-tRNA synthetase [Candidatus Caldarchaeum subterraneum]BAJ51242.1 seryl-tRNA synthetase [Candidatus Caldarchaeum subterraneum]GBC72422.1 Serine--tRNA ligase [archaeon HR03]